MVALVNRFLHFSRVDAVPDEEVLLASCSAQRQRQCRSAFQSSGVNDLYLHQSVLGAAVFADSHLWIRFAGLPLLGLQSDIAADARRGGVYYAGAGRQSTFYVVTKVEILLAGDCIKLRPQKADPGRFGCAGRFGPAGGL